MALKQNTIASYLLTQLYTEVVYFERFTPTRF